MRQLVISVLLIISLTTRAQFEDISGKFDVHAGYSLPLGNNYPINGGISIGAEPKFWYNETIVVGAKLGFNFLASPVTDVKLAPLTSVCLVGEKYSGGDGLATFFIGGSAGAYIGGHTKRFAGTTTTLKAPVVLGLAPRAGIQFGPYRLMAEYHIRKQSAKFISIILGYTLGGE